MARIEITHNFEGEVTPLIFQWYKTTSPLTAATGLVDGAVVTRKTYAAPHDQESLLIEELDPVMYLVRVFRSADGVTLDEEINRLACDARIGARYILYQLYYQVGRGLQGDPAPDDHGLRDERLYNMNYRLEERGTGTLIPPAEPGGEYIDRSDDGGGFDFVDPDKVFNEFGWYIAHVQNAQDVSVVETETSLEYTNVVPVFALTDYDVELHNKKILIASAPGTVGVLNIGALAIIPDSKFKLNTHGGAQRNYVIQFNVGDTVNFRGAAVNKIVLGKGEWIEILFKDNVAYVIDGDTGHSQVGDLVYTREVNQINRLLADGSGAQLNESDYPRAVELMDRVGTVTILAWNTDRGKWGRGGGKFIVPDHISYGFVRGVTANPGRYQAGTVGDFVLKLPNTALAVGEGGSADTKLTTGSVASPTNGIDITVQGATIDGERKTKPDNIGLHPMICI